MGYFKTPKEKKQLFFTYAAFLLNGALALSIGSLLPFVRESKGLNYAFAGLLVSLHSVGNLISSFASGALAAAIGRKKSILLFNVCYALSCIMLMAGSNLLTLALAYLMTGLARGASSNFGNYTINSIAPGRAEFLNGLHAMFSIGAFCFPILLTALTREHAEGWIYACCILAAMGVLSWLFYLMIPDSERVAAQKDGSGGAKGSDRFGFFREPLFYLCTFTLFFYLCAEQGVIGWMITYFKDMGLLGDALSQLMASILWIMILAGRLTTALASGKVPKERLLLVMGIGFVGFFFWLLLCRETALIIIGIMGFGYSMAGIYPTVVSFCGELIQKYSMAWSFILTIASLGSILMPMIIGRIAESAGIACGMASVTAVALVDLALIVALNVYRKI